MSRFKASAAFRAAIRESLLARVGGNAAADLPEHVCASIVKAAPPRLLAAWEREGRSADDCGHQLVQLLGRALRAEVMH